VPVFPLTVPGFTLHDELLALVRAGVPPAVALRAATLEPARYLGAADSLGTIETGKVADLVLLDGNPLADIRNTARVNAVVLRGRLIDALDRRRMLQELALRAAK
jgi:imidazolonepropionase-like amidohydrolase